MVCFCKNLCSGSDTVTTVFDVKGKSGQTKHGKYYDNKDNKFCSVCSKKMITKLRYCECCHQMLRFTRKANKIHEVTEY